MSGASMKTATMSERRCASLRVAWLSRGSVDARSTRYRGARAAPGRAGQTFRQLCPKRRLSHRVPEGLVAFRAGRSNPTARAAARPVEESSGYKPMEAVDSLSISAAGRWQLAARRAVTHSLIVWPPLALGWVLVIGLREHAIPFHFEPR